MNIIIIFFKLFFIIFLIMFFIFLIFFFYISYISNSYIKMPFYKNNTNDFISNYLNIQLNTNFKIGNPPQNIHITLSFLTQSFILKGSLYNSEYNEKESNKSIIYNHSGLIFYDGTVFHIEYGCDRVLFENYSNVDVYKNIKIDGFVFQLLNDSSMTDKFKSGILGLSNIVYRDDYDIPFINHLTTRLIIKNRIFFIDYENDTFGYIYFGNFPHFFDNNIYEEKNYRRVKNNYYSMWNLNFNNYYIGEKVINGSSVNINFHFKGIIVDENLKKIFDELFFNKYNYLEKKNCEVNIYKVLENNILVYKCDDSINIKKFPKFKMFHKSYNFTFEFDGNELFLKDKFENKYIFLISFKKNEYFFQLGEIFIRKYMLVFNHGEKDIGMYIQINKNNSKFLKISKQFLILLIFIILIFTIIILSFFLWKAHKKKRKLRANELEDNYEYIINQ